MSYPENTTPQSGDGWVLTVKKILASLNELVSALGGGTSTAQGGLRSVPAGTTNGAELAGKPSSTDGVRFYLGDAESVTIFFAAAGSAPGSPPTLTVTIGPFDGGLTVDEPTAGTDTIFVTAKSGTPTYRWVQR